MKMQNKSLPIGITVIYFNDKSKNIYAKLPPDRELAKELARRIYKDAMIEISAEKSRQKASRKSPDCIHK